MCSHPVQLPHHCAVASRWWCFESARAPTVSFAGGLGEEEENKEEEEEKEEEEAEKEEGGGGGGKGTDQPVQVRMCVAILWCVHACVRACMCVYA